MWLHRVKQTNRTGSLVARPHQPRGPARTHHQSGAARAGRGARRRVLHRRPPSRRLNIPPGQVDALAPTLLPDRDAQIVVYCTETCASSDAVARRLEELGYGNVAVYEGGKADWAEHNLPLERSDDAEAV